MSLSRLDLNLLLTLDAVLAERSVARAADRLHVTGSAVSNALARLRHELGDPLVVRNGRGIVPTPRALALWPALSDALASIQRAIKNERFDPKTTTRQFTLALADAGQLAQLPTLSRIMATEMPRSSLRVFGIDTYLALGGAASTEIDAAIARTVGESPGMHICDLYEERSALFASKQHSLIRRRLTKVQLASLQHVEIQVAPGRGYRDLEERYIRLGIRRQVRTIVPSFIAAAAIIAETELVATLPTSLVETFKAQFSLNMVKGEAPTIVTPLQLVWHDRTHADPACCAFRAIVSRVMQDR